MQSPIFGKVGSAEPVPLRFLGFGLFWSNEGSPVEPVHFHIAEGGPTANATKVWVTSAGKCLLANNNSNIPERALRNVIRVAEARSAEIVAQWEDRFGPAKFYL